MTMRRWSGVACLALAVLLVFLATPAQARELETDQLPARVQREFGPLWPYRFPSRARAAAETEKEPETVAPADNRPVPTGFDENKGVYVVQEGDTLWAISIYLGISPEVVLNANQLGPGDVLLPGMELAIPYSNRPGSARYGLQGPVVSGKGLHFVASISQQMCWLFRDGSQIERWTCSTGRPESPSAPGNYTVQSKEERAYNIPSEFWMPEWLGLYSAGTYENGIHGLPYRASNGEKYWQDEVGTPVTFGCVMLDDAAATELFQLADIGMPVTILP